MPHASAKDGTRLHYEEAGAGTPLLFIHEFAGDHRSWEPQLRFFARYFRCITFAARGFPPSDIPEDGERYSQAHARDDALAVLSDDQRRRFYDIANPRLRDPDTYAVLNWSLLAGMHHFYLGRWLRGSATLLCFIGGVAALFSDPLRWPALLVLCVILVIELSELFRSHTIVQDHNNRMMARALDELGA